jgi:MoaA/NifB/PqqE/SkfB family radical SAM enzyme
MARPVQYMNLGLAKRLISEIHAYQLSRKIGFHVLGEPSLHPAFFDIFDFATRLDLYISLVTNGMLLHDDFGRRLCTYVPDELIISIQTPDSRSFACRNAPISFGAYKQSVLRFIGDLLRSGKCANIVFRFLSTYYLEKAQGLDSLYGGGCSDFSIQREAMKSWARAIYNVMGAGKQATHKALQRLRTIQLRNCNRIYIHPRIRFDVLHMLEWVDWSQRDDVPEAITGDCLHRKDDIAVLSNGDVTLCCLDFNGHTALGNVSDALLKDIMTSNKASYVLSEFEQGRIALPYCRKCIGSWQEFLKALSAGNTLRHTQKAMQLTRGSECYIW